MVGVRGVGLICRKTFTVPSTRRTYIIALASTRRRHTLSVMASGPVTGRVGFHRLSGSIGRPRLMSILTEVVYRRNPRTCRIIFRTGKGVNPGTGLIGTASKSTCSLPRSRTILLTIATNLRVFAGVRILRGFAAPFHGSIVDITLPVIKLPSSLLGGTLRGTMRRRGCRKTSFVHSRVGHHRRRGSRGGLAS